MSLLRNTSWSAAGSITSTVGRMVIVVVLARRLGPALFGLFVFVQWLIDISSIACSAGLPGTATRFFPQTAGNGPTTMAGFGRWFFRRSVVAVVITSVVATVSVVAFSDLAEPASIAAVTFWAASAAAWALLGARAVGLFQFKRYAASSALFVAVALLALLLPLGDGVITAMVGFGAANFAAAVCCGAGVLANRQLDTDGPLTKPDTRVVHSYAANAWLTAMAASFVWARGEISVVKGHLGESAVGFYSVGLTLSAVVNQGLALLTGGLWPQIASGWDSGQRDSVLKLSSRVTNVLILAAGVSSGVVICLAPELVTLLFGTPFRQSSGLVLILALGPLGLGAGCAHLVLQAATNGKFARNVTLAGGFALFATAFLLVPRFGMSGAAVARSATQVGIGALTLFWLGKATGHNERTRQNLRSFLLVSVVAGLLVTFLSLEPDLQLPGRLGLLVVYFSLVGLSCAPIWDGGTLPQLRSLVGGDVGEPNLRAPREVDLSLTNSLDQGSSRVSS